jgi:hypothetical protein
MNKCGKVRKDFTLAGRQWLIPVILATQETDIRRIVVRGQLGKMKVRSCLKNTQYKKIDWLKGWNTCLLSVSS